MIELSGLRIGYADRALLKDVNTIFHQSSLTALIGRNGSGKSTLLRALAGLNHSYSGRILIDGIDAAATSASTLARKMAFVNTERVRIPNLKCRDIVAMGRAPFTDWIGRLSPEDEKAIDEALAITGMESYASRTMDTMSDGECQRIMVARAIAQDTPNVLLDEPTSFLDLPGRYSLVSLLAEMAHSSGKTILFSTHELDIALRMADYVALIADYTIYNLPAHDMLDSGLVESRFGISLPISR